MSDYQTIVIAVDFSEASKQVMQKGMSIAGQYGANVFLLHVVEQLPPVDFTYEPIGTPDWYFENEELIIDQARKSLHELAQQHGIPQDNTAVLSGAPKHEIIQHAEDKQADLIVIGSHGRHGIQRLLGSTAYPVLHHAACDVLAIRIKDQTD